MNDLEERLRDAYRSAADTVTPESVPEPRMTARAAAHAGRSRRFAPVAAAAGVAAVVLAATVLTAHSPAARHQPPAASRHSRSAASGVPPFTVVSEGSDLRVYRTGTTRLLSRVTPPPGLRFASVANGGTAGTFLVAAQAGATTGAGCQAAFYRFRVGPGGQASPLTLVRRVHGSLPTALAASLGGRTIAYATVHCATGNSTGTLPATAPIGYIGITGPQGNRTWTFDLGEDYPSYLSVTASGDTLAFPMYAGDSQNPVLSLYLLSTASAAKTVAGASTILKAIHPSSAAISPDGSRIYASAAGAIRDYTASGRPVWTLDRSAGTCGLALDETGRYLVTECTTSGANGAISGLDLRTGKTIRLPYGTDVSYTASAVAW